MTDTPTIEEIMRLKKPNQRTVDIPLDPAIANQIVALEDQIDQKIKELSREQSKASAQVGKSLAEGGKLQEIQKEIEKLEGDLDTLWTESGDSIVSFVFQDIGRKAYDDLVTAHPPTDEQKKEWEDEGGEGRLAYNIQTFPPALLAATSHSPKLTVKDADKIFDDWGNWEVTRLFNAAQAVCVVGANVPKSRRSPIDTDETTTSD